MPFVFAPGYENRRCNLTLLFGDRWSTGGVSPSSTGAAASGADSVAPAATAGAGGGSGGGGRAAALQSDKKTAELWSLFD